ncbi:hypothetical protein BJV77DRAFT_180518 [Russula vinacea]|nr:hypothetical protein BJV77DRAFT_180518 [Russula vinacea]
MDSDQALIPIACRFVASDQWLTAYFDPTWKISEVKQYILAKVYNRSIDNDHLPSRDRPVSPITFASARTSFDSNLEGSLQDDHIIDLEPHLLSEPARQLRMRQPLSQRVASPSGVPGSPTEPAPAIIPRTTTRCSRSRRASSSKTTVRSRGTACVRTSCSSCTLPVRSCGSSGTSCLTTSSLTSNSTCAPSASSLMIRTRRMCLVLRRMRRTCPPLIIRIRS